MGQKKTGRQPMASSSVSPSTISAWGKESGCQYNFPHAGQVKSSSSKGASQCGQILLLVAFFKTSAFTGIRSFEQKGKNQADESEAGKHQHAGRVSLCDAMQKPVKPRE